MGTPAERALRVTQATPADHRQALALAFADLPPSVRESQTERLISETANVSLAGVWAGYRGQRLAAAMIAQIQPGRTAVIAPPKLAAEEPTGTAEQVAQVVMSYLGDQGVRIVQSLLETDHGSDASLLVSLGFRHVSNLIYLVSLYDAFPTAEPHDGLEFLPSDSLTRERLARLIERTYFQSLDCPEIDGVRDINDVLDGYRATGVFDPKRWVIARHAEQDVGCVLLTDHPKHVQWELLYMGVVPDARGQGFGVAITRHAQWLARQAGAARLVLAVDGTNVPAIDMYAACGFVSWDHRSVFLRVFD